MMCRVAHRRRIGPWLLLAAALTACELPEATRDDGRRTQGIARLEVMGPNVTVNGRPAINGMIFNSGDYLATGPASRARLRFFKRGILQLEENTDPGIWERLLDTGKCIIAYLLDRGIVSGQTGQCDAMITTPQGNDILVGSQYVLSANPQSSVLTILKGQATLTDGRRITVREGEQIVVTRDGVTGPRRLSTLEIRRLLDWLNSYDFTGNRRPVYPLAVPRVEGLQFAEAERRLSQLGLGLRQVGERRSGQVPTGTILEQRPPRGDLVPPGTDVHVFVAQGGQALVPVPNLMGLELERAKRELRAAGLALGQLSKEVTTREPPDTVLEQEPGRGAQVQRNTTVNLVISVAPPDPVAPPPPLPVPVVPSESLFQPGHGLRRGQDTSGLDVLTLEELKACLRKEQAYFKRRDERDLAKDGVDKANKRLDQREAKLKDLGANLDGTDPAAVRNYEQVQKQFNALVDDYNNNLLPDLRAKVQKVTAIVDDFNKVCGGKRYYTEDMIVARRDLGLQ